MFRYKIRCTEKTDVDAEIETLRANCSRANLPSSTVEVVAADVGEALHQLVERGRQLAASGSHMHVDREINGDGYSIKLIFSVNEKRSLLQRVVGALKGD